MKLIQVHNKTLLLSKDGVIHAPYSLFLNDKFDNPHTRESSASGLRLFESFLHAHSISLPYRAQEGLCLLPSEIQSLTELAYRPVNEVEQMSKVMIKHIGKASKDHSSKHLKGAVEPNTAGRRLDQIAAFLTWYLETVLDYRIRSSSQREELRRRYNQTTDGLKARIRGGRKGHPNEIRSLPEEVFLKIVKDIFLRPESIIQSASGKPSATRMRDRAIALLACEGLRPGAIGSLTLSNFRWRAGDVAGGYMDISDNVAKRKTRTTTKTPVQKGIGSTTQSYNSDGTIKLWPWTCHAIKDYIDGERASLTGKTLANKTKGFLFIADHGGPIGDRTTLSAAFGRLKKGLRSEGLLNKSESDQYQKDAYYEFTAYTLRHSSASLFHDRKRHEKDVEDQMRMRFGWSAKSTMPSHYARRSISNRANVDLMNFYESLVVEMKKPKENA